MNIIVEDGFYYRTKDSRGPMRVVLNVDEQADGTYITFSCGHTGTFNQIFHYSDPEMRCFQCRLAEDNVISKETL